MVGFCTSRVRQISCCCWLSLTYTPMTTLTAYFKSNSLALQGKIGACMWPYQRIIFNIFFYYWRQWFYNIYNYVYLTILCFFVITQNMLFDLLNRHLCCGVYTKCCVACSDVNAIAVANFFRELLVLLLGMHKCLDIRFTDAYVGQIKQLLFSK